jgi:hypothetical protein
MVCALAEVAAMSITTLAADTDDQSLHASLPSRGARMG